MTESQFINNWKSTCQWLEVNLSMTGSPFVIDRKSIYQWPEVKFENKLTWEAVCWKHHQWLDPNHKPTIVFGNFKISWIKYYFFKFKKVLHFISNSRMFYPDHFLNFKISFRSHKGVYYQEIPLFDFSSQGTWRGRWNVRDDLMLGSTLD